MNTIKDLDTRFSKTELMNDQISEGDAISGAFLDLTFGQILSELTETPVRRWWDLTQAEKAKARLPTPELYELKRAKQELLDLSLDAPKAITTKLERMRKAAYALDDLQSCVIDRLHASAEEVPVSLLAACVGHHVDTDETDATNVAMNMSLYAHDGNVGKRMFRSVLKDHMFRGSLEHLTHSLDTVSDLQRLLELDNEYTDTEILHDLERGVVYEPSWILGYRYLRKHFGADTSVRDFLSNHCVDL